MSEVKEKLQKNIDEVTVRFAGDSGDGMQLTGTQFSDTTAVVGNDLSTLPDYPAEIRAPAGTLYGVSGFQLHFSSEEIHTPGDVPDVLVAMNPAALKKNLAELKRNGLIVVNSDAFDKRNLKLAGYEANPLEDGALEGYDVMDIPITSLTFRALEESELSQKEKSRCKNFFALGLMYWLFNRPIEQTVNWIEKKFNKRPDIIDANEKVLKAGYHFGDITERFTTRYTIDAAKLEPGTYRNISGNEATALGFVVAAEKAGLKLFLGSYPITPASDILQYLSKYKDFGVKTFQAEDEIAGICSAIGAAFGGSLAITTTSGPGLALKTEATGLAVMTELPLVIVNVQRGGPSTGLPTKTEQADLLQAMYGRNGESPVAVVSASTPSDCFFMAIEASRLALTYMSPVILLTDGYLANGSEPWNIPSVDSIPEIPVEFYTDPETYHPYSRDENLVRPWAVPGTIGLEHRIGGLEKQNITGDVNYDPDNHFDMIKIREEKIKNMANSIPDLKIEGDEDADIIVIGWGGTYGAIKEAVMHSRKKGYKVAQTHFNYINPFPKNTEEVLRKYKHILLPEINLGQLSRILKSEFLLPIIQFNVVRGLPFRVGDIENKIVEVLGGNNE